MKGYTKYFFVMEYTLSKGLTYNEDMVITIGAKTLVKDTDYPLTVTKNADGTTSLEIVFKNFIQYKGQTDAAITLTYSATLNQDAVLDPTTGNPNTVKPVSYTHLDVYKRQDIIYELQKQNEQNAAQIEKLQAALDEKELHIENAGSRCV